jgi:hypothetical protein
MGLALEQAERALAHGDVPVGAVALVDGRPVAARHNERERTGDPTAHAEILALRDASVAVGGWWQPASGGWSTGSSPIRLRDTFLAVRVPQRDVHTSVFTNWLLQPTPGKGHSLPVDQMLGIEGDEHQPH